ncbi:hypothetical protein EPI10_022114 [Gossypium australe]|uniref:Uncharacterized protein n=1 Tax=Gossypium australe TaxID=47621 RepID=A0A5B6WKR9_9ROSI|nr:hypothetical protein EPI10_022114 [Gossypium australe]
MVTVLVLNNQIHVGYVAAKHQAADVFTKPYFKNHERSCVSSPTMMLPTTLLNKEKDRKHGEY